MDWFWSYTLIKPTTCTTNSVRLQGLESIFMTHSKSSNPTFQLLNITFFSTISSPDEYGISLAPNTATSLSVLVNEMTRLPSPYKSKCMEDWSSTGLNVSVSSYSLSVSIHYIIREGLTRKKKKKCEISHFWSRPPPPKNCET